MSGNFGKRPNWLQIGILLFFTSVSVARIVLTYSVFNQTWDEPVHIASGMQWLQQGTYTYEELHPPLARIAVAIGPYLDGIRLKANDINPAALSAGGNAILAAHGTYIHNLALARLGVLPFLFLAIGIIWYWTRSLFDNWSAVAAVGLFTTLPPVLGHAGVATTDLALTATLTLALFAFVNWLDRPTTRNSLVLGLAAGLAILSKFTALLFLPVCGMAVLLCWLFTSPVTVLQRLQSVSLLLKQLLLAALLCAAVIFACYQFSFHPVTAVDSRPHQFLDHLFGHQERLHDAAYYLVENVPVPVPEFFNGINQARGRTTEPTSMYLLGEVQTRGWWYFFPVALGVKTPIAFLILTVVGAFGISNRWMEGGHDWRILAPLASAFMLLLVCLPTKFNIGLRHILPIYTLLSVIAGFGICSLWHSISTRWLGRILAIGLAGWILVSTSMAHPDYLAYFNEFVGDHPERILVDSDLDWGQDLLRLSKDLRSRGVTHIALAYNGTADLGQMNLPPFDLLAPCTPAAGWIAISLLKLQMSEPSIGCGGFSWLKAYKPVALVGKSIQLYCIPKTAEVTYSPSTLKR